jgi:hypothetical protein
MPGTGTYLSHPLPAPRFRGGGARAQHQGRVLTPAMDIIMNPSEQDSGRWGEERMKGLWRQRMNFYTLSPQITGLARPPGADLPFSCQVYQNRSGCPWPILHIRSLTLQTFKGSDIARHRPLLSRNPFFDVLWRFSPWTRNKFITTDAACSVHRSHLLTPTIRPIRPCHTQWGAYSLTRPSFITFGSISASYGSIPDHHRLFFFDPRPRQRKQPRSSKLTACRRFKTQPSERQTLSWEYTQGKRGNK